MKNGKMTPGEREDAAAKIRATNPMPYQYRQRAYDTLIERAEYDRVKTQLESALEALRDIAVMRNSSKRQRVNSERAITWLFAHGYPLEPGGYVPGVGFTEEI
jgi:hypothetical protein